MMIEEKIYVHPFSFRRESYFEDRESKREYARIVGGLTWPGINPGCLVLVGEERWDYKSKGMQNYRVLAEYESHDPSKLINRAGELCMTLQANPFYGDTSNRLMMEMVRKSDANFILTEAPFLDDPNGFVSYLVLIRELTQATQKILHLGKGSQLSSILSAMSAETIPKSMN
jgi:hypothetical protein